MDVTVRYDGTNKEVAVPVTGRKMKVSDFQAALEAIIDLPPEKQFLMFNGKKVLPVDAEGGHTTLFDYGINRKDLLVLMPKAVESPVKEDPKKGTKASSKRKHHEVEPEPAAEAEKPKEEPKPEEPQGPCHGAYFVDQRGSFQMMGRTLWEEPENTKKGCPDGVKCRWARTWLVADVADAGGMTGPVDPRGYVGQSVHRMDKRKKIPGEVRRYVAANEGEEDKYEVVFGVGEEGKSEMLSVAEVEALIPANRQEDIGRANRSLLVEFEHSFEGPIKSYLMKNVYKLLYRPADESAMDTTEGDKKEVEEKPFEVVGGQSVLSLNGQKLTFRIRAEAEGEEGEAKPTLRSGVYTVGLTVEADEQSCKECRGQPAISTCKECGCQVCEKKDHEEAMLGCDQCATYWHSTCLDGKKHTFGEGNVDHTALPDDDWFCPTCYVDKSKIDEGALKKKSKKKLQPADLTDKNWGGGMACVGKSTTNTLIGDHHVGPVPGIRVGQLWPYRVNCSEDGVHPPIVAGMYGTPKTGCLSIVLSGGYDDDQDEGDWFWYTGAGGRDLSGNKRSAEQSKDQELKSTNLALANCHNKKDWKKGQPIRVIRCSKLAKTNHGDYAPSINDHPNCAEWKQCFRYDGLYKVVEWGPQKGNSGFIVYRYKLKRDDPEPAPWTKKGKENLVAWPKHFGDLVAEAASTGTKKLKLDETRSKEMLAAIAKDKANKDKWDDVLSGRSDQVPLEHDRDTLQKIEDKFQCTICMDLCRAAMTLPCSHNMCRDCFQRGMKSATICPMCRQEVPKEIIKKAPIDKDLHAALALIFGAKAEPQKN
eukprot:comp22162_c0_seq1/m.32491 comp22162_c0_seq1/g.32491  ORF comp22162_c0_seq1/g.32491 comp22162_c0_seq1/m.32491 type:complete len:816 (-) comp22162_c0_seq1:813-3260(-)